jgi:C_GCAxxG_C_C family probable redox protein
MKQRLKRREFARRIGLSTLSVAALGACTSEEKPRKDEPAQNGQDKFSEALAENRLLPRDLAKQMLDQKVDQYMQRSHHCAQSSFMALKEQFALEGEQVFKALTPLPGIAERGETCGAVTGPLMAMGLIYGRGIQQMENWDLYQSSLVPAGKFCAQFEKEFGTTLCHKVQEGKFGRCYRLTDPGELQEFQKNGATEKCSEVVRSAVHMAADIILDDKELA